MFMPRMFALQNEDRGDEVSAGGGDDALDTKLASGDDTPTAEELAAKKAEADAAAAKAADKSIPKARFDEAVSKERARAEAAEKRLQELEAAAAARDEAKSAEKLDAEIVELEEKLDAAIADGNKDQAKQLRAEIRTKERALSDARADEKARYATALAVERINYASTVKDLEAKHPALNPDSDDYDQEVVDEFLELKGAYEATGMGSTEAVRKAAKFIFKDAPAQAKADLKKEPSEEEKKAAAEEAARLKEEAIRRGQKAKAGQPAADADKVGAGGDKRGGGAATAEAVLKMSDKDFEKLSEDDKRRMRGDMV